MEGKNGYFSPVSNGTGSGVNAREKRILFTRFQWNREWCERGLSSFASRMKDFAMHKRCNGAEIIEKNARVS